MIKFKNILLILCLVSLSGCLSISEAWQGADIPSKEQQLVLARALSQKEAYQPAINLYEKLVKANPKKEKIRAELAELYIKTNQFEVAEVHYNYLVSRQGGNCLYLNGLGVSLLRLRKFAEAELQFQSCLQVQPNNKSAMKGYALALDMRGSSFLAIPVYKTLLAQDPLNRNVRNNFALCLLLSGQVKQAVSEFNSIAFDPQATVQMRQNLALSYAMQGEVEIAKEITALDFSAQQVLENSQFFEFLSRTRNLQALKTFIYGS